MSHKIRSISICPYITLYPAIIDIDNMTGVFVALTKIKTCFIKVGT